MRFRLVYSNVLLAKRRIPLSRCHVRMLILAGAGDAGIPITGGYGLLELRQISFKIETSARFEKRLKRIDRE
jgi:hypothetical protein